MSVSTCMMLLTLMTSQGLGQRPGMTSPLPDDGVNDSLQYHIVEELPSSTLIGRVAVDAGLDRLYPPHVRNEFRYRFLEQPNDNREYFAIEETTGILHTTEVIDRDVICAGMSECTLSLSIAISPADYFRIIEVRVEVMDKNDHSPEFPEKQVKFILSESATPESMLSLSAAEDPDSPDNGIQHYELISDTSQFELRVVQSLDGSTELKLVVIEPLDREVVDMYSLRVVAQDGGNPPKSGTVTVNITITDTNDNSPQFTQASYEVNVPEDLEMGIPIVKMYANDSDLGNNGRITYRFTPRTITNFGRWFSIGEDDGVVTLGRPLDYEQVQTYHLVVIAEDQGEQSRSSQTTLVVDVADVNDNPPQITLNMLTSSGDAEISEASPEGTFVAHISVLDMDSGINKEVDCDTDSEVFQLDYLYREQYKLVTKTQLDRETKDSYQVTLICTDHGTSPLSSSTEFTINVVDANDHSPQFRQPIYTYTISEGNQPNKFLLQVNASDLDTGVNANLLYTLNRNASQHTGLFDVDIDTGMIYAAYPLDHELSETYELHLMVRDQGDPPRSARTLVVINVLDVNDEQPIFSLPSYSFSVHENKPTLTDVGSVRAQDADSPPFNEIEYSLDTEGAMTFSINPLTGHIVTRDTLDRETKSVYRLVVKASNPGRGAPSSSVPVTVYIMDENDNDPVIDFPSPANNTITLSNRAGVGYVVGRIRAHDNDIGANGRVSAFLSPSVDGIFRIDAGTGAVTTAVSLRDIVHRVFNLTVTVRDSGSEPRVATRVLYIVVDSSAPLILGATGVEDASEEVEEEGLFTGTNLVLLCAVAGGSLLVILALLIAIIVIKLMDRKHRRAKRYNCRTEAQKMLSAANNGLVGGDEPMSPSSTLDHMSLCSSNTSGGRTKTRPPRLVEGTDTVRMKGSLSAGQETIGSPGADSQSGLLEMDARGWPLGTPSTQAAPPTGAPRLTSPVSTLDRRGRDPPSRDHRLSMCSSVGSAQQPSISRTSSPPPQLPWSDLTQKEIEVHRLLQYLQRPDQHQDRDSSTDSGCGPSEEGTDPRADPHTLPPPPPPLPTVTPVIPQTQGGRANAAGARVPCKPSHEILDGGHPCEGPQPLPPSPLHANPYPAWGWQGPHQCTCCTPVSRMEPKRWPNAGTAAAVPALSQRFADRPLPCPPPGSRMVAGFEDVPEDDDVSSSCSTTSGSYVLEQQSLPRHHEEYHHQQHHPDGGGAPASHKMSPRKRHHGNGINLHDDTPQTLYEETSA